MRITFLTLLAVLALLAPRPSMAQEDLTDQHLPAPALSGQMVQGQPLILGKGKVTLVYFWTLGCINCKHNLPAYNRYAARFAPNKVVQMVGVHSPEFDWERPATEVAQAIKEHAITYPVLDDGAGQNWDRYQQRYWPTIYLVDKQGQIRYRYIGELGQGKRSAEARVAALVDKLAGE